MTGIMLDKNIDTPKRLNDLAREQMRLKLLNDILIDLKICQIEGWDTIKYLKSLQTLISSFITNGRGGGE